MTGNQLVAIVEACNDPVRLLRDADPQDKAELYGRIGLRLTYRLIKLAAGRTAKGIGLVNPAIRWAGAGVYDGGALAYLTTRTRDEDTVELGITTHGPDSAKLAEHVVDLLKFWPIAGRLNPGSPPTQTTPAESRFAWRARIPARNHPHDQLVRAPLEHSQRRAVSRPPWVWRDDRNCVSPIHGVGLTRGGATSDRQYHRPVT